MIVLCIAVALHPFLSGTIAADAKAFAANTLADGFAALLGRYELNLSGITKAGARMVV